MRNFPHMVRTIFGNSVMLFAFLLASISAHAATTKVNGVCGGADGRVLTSTYQTASELCSAGTPTPFTVSGTLWDWTCTGSDGGSSVACRGYVPPGGTTTSSSGSGSTSGAGSSGGTVTTTGTGTPDRIAFGSAAQSVPLGDCAALSIVTQNSSMKTEAGANAITITMSGGSGDIEFYSNAACTVKSTTFTIPAGHSSGTFYISGSKEGSYELTARASNSLGAASQTDEISAPPPPTCSGNEEPPTAAPSQAAAAGFNALVFDDEFNSADTISPNGSGTYNWYAGPSITPSDYIVSNGCLTILTDVSGYGDDLYTPTSYQHGYFEARLQFYPAGSQGGAWPAFWSFATEAAAGGPPFAELDFIEAYPGGGGGSTDGNNGVTFLTTVHQWTPTATSETGTNVQNSDITPIPAGFNYDAFHIYGMLWVPDSVTWYIDNEPVMTVATGPGTDFTALEQDYMSVILGTGKNWPMTVDYVHIWH